MGDVDLAGAAQLGRRRPEHIAVVAHHRPALHKASCKVVRTATVSHAIIARTVGSFLQITFNYFTIFSARVFLLRNITNSLEAV